MRSEHTPSVPMYSHQDVPGPLDLYACGPLQALDRVEAADLECPKCASLSYSALEENLRILGDIDRRLKNREIDFVDLDSVASLPFVPM